MLVNPHQNVMNPKDYVLMIDDMQDSSDAVLWTYESCIKDLYRPSDPPGITKAKSLEISVICWKVS